MTTDRDEGPDDRASATKQDAVAMAEHLATLTRSGLPLPSGLRAVGAEVGPGALRSILVDTANRLDRGEPLGEALAVAGTRFPPQVRALVEAGARSGRLADILAEFVRHANLGHDLRRGIGAAVAYPLILLTILGGILFLACRMAVQVVGTLDSVSRDFGLGVAPVNEIVLRTARWVTESGLLALAALLGVAAVTWVAARVAWTPGARRRFALGLPLVGPILRWSALAEFCHLLGLLVDAEVPLPEALEMAGAGVGDADLSERCWAMAQEVAAGRSLADAVAAWPAIPAGLGQVFRWSEGRRALPEALHLAGDLFEARARSQARFTNHAFVAFLFLLIANGLGFALLLLLQPIYLIGRLAGLFTSLS